MATLYRKYRAKTFDGVIGQAPIVTTLTNQVKLGRIGHAYLFTGSRGTGKTTCARIFARAINCLHPVNGSPCGECEVCKALEKADNVDIIEMDAASNNGVDDARDIREKVKYTPVSCRYKVYIIDEVHMLTGGAFNALLKTIEEPPEHVVFILATTEPQKLPQTILSRCIRFDFHLVSTDEIAKHIASIYDAEGIKYMPDAVEAIARQGEGSVRDALSIADTLMSAADVITVDVVKNLTGAGDGEDIARLFDSAASGNIASALSVVDEFSKRGKSMAAVAHQLSYYARNTLVVKAVGASAFERGIVNADKAVADRIARSAETFSLEKISSILEALGACENGLKYSVNPRVYLETALVKIVGAEEKKQDILKRLLAVEKRLSIAPADPTDQKKNERIAPVRSEQAAKSVDTVSAQPAKPTEADIGKQTTGERSIVTAEHSAKPVQATTPEKNVAQRVDRPAKQDGAYASRYADEPEPECPPPPEEYIPQAEYARGTSTERASAKPAAPVVAKKDGGNVKAADEGEFMHNSARKYKGLKLLGGVASYLRKKNTFAAARAHELLSRGAAVKEREDVVAFVVPDDNFLSFTEESILNELNAALRSIGINKPARPEKTAEDLYADDLMRARELFGRDSVVPKSAK